MASSAPSSSTTRFATSGAFLLHADFLLTGIVMTFLGPMLPILAARWAMSDAVSGRLYLTQFISSMFGMLSSAPVVQRRGYRFTFIIGLLASLWSANAGMKSLFDALNLVYNEPEKRSFVWLNVISLTFTVLAIVFALVAIGTMVVVPIVLNFLGLAGATEMVIKIARWPALFIVVSLALAVLYRYGPSREKPRWRWITWGSAFAAIAWLIVSILFSWYAENFGSYNKTYGSLGAIIGFMFWIWLSTIVVLIGAELNAETEHQTVRDTTTGRPKPIGARGATMADTVGAKQD